MKFSVLIILSFWCSTALFAQKHGAYIIYNSKGKKVSYDAMVKDLSKTDIVLFGELHDNPIAHWLQLKLAQSLAASRDLVMGAEMIETDDQSHLDDYLSGKIDQKGFDTLARLWINHKTDYKPLVDLAKGQQLPFIATNIPRRYASMVYKQGFESLGELPDSEKAFIAPLPIPYDASLSQYQRMLTMMGDHASERFPMAQAIKDATMAHFILSNWKPNQLFLHFNGSFHSNYYEGIYWYLKTYNNAVQIKTLNTVLVEDISKPEKEIFHTADYIIVVEHEMTSTY